MLVEVNTIGLELTEEEAFTLLSLAMTSSQRLDAKSEAALHKLASFCKSRSFDSNHIKPTALKLEEAG